MGSRAANDYDCGDDDDGSGGGGGGGFGEVDDAHSDFRIRILWNLMLCRWLSDSDISKDSFEMSMQGNNRTT